MANMKMEFTFDTEAKRILKNLTKALDRLSREKHRGLRLTEPVEEPPTIELDPETVRRIVEATETELKV